MSPTSRVNVSDNAVFLDIRDPKFSGSFIEKGDSVLFSRDKTASGTSSRRSSRHVDRADSRADRDAHRSRARTASRRRSCS